MTTSSRHQPFGLLSPHASCPAALLTPCAAALQPLQPLPCSADDRPLHPHGLAQRYDELGATLDEVTEDEVLDDLGPWRTLKVPFTAFRDRTFYQRAEVVSVVYVLLAGETPGPLGRPVRTCSPPLPGPPPRTHRWLYAASAALPRAFLMVGWARAHILGQVCS